MNMVVHTYSWVEVGQVRVSKADHAADLVGNEALDIIERVISHELFVLLFAVLLRATISWLQGMLCTWCVVALRERLFPFLHVFTWSMVSIERIGALMIR